MNEAEIAKGVTQGFLETIRDILKNAWNKIIRRKTEVAFVEIQHRCIWTSASADGKPVAQIITEWYATNNSQKSVKLLNAHLLKPNTKNQPLKKIIFMVRRETNSAHDGLDMPIQPYQTGVMTATFFVELPTKKFGEDLTVQLSVTDQYGQEHRTPKIRVNFAGK
jgi:hypothetical protein